MWSGRLTALGHRSHNNRSCLSKMRKDQQNETGMLPGQDVLTSQDSKPKDGAVSQHVGARLNRVRTCGQDEEGGFDGMQRAKLPGQSADVQ